MTDRKQARAMDLPDYPCPPTIGEIATHAGTWGWINPGYVAQDEDGYLWVERSGHPRPTPQPPWDLQGIVVWTEEGLALYLPHKGYGHMKLLRGAVDEALWAPVASVLKEPPGYARNFNQS